MKLKEKVAVITGGGSGIGRSICLKFAREGAKIVIADAVDKVAQATLKETKKISNNVIKVIVDVKNESQVRNMINKTINSFGKLDILVNSAGILGPMSKSIEHLSFEEWIETLEINLVGSGLTIKYAIPEIRKSGGGSIINLASIAGLNPIDGAAPYCVSKAGIIMLTKVAALEYGKDRIRVNAICPDKINTPMMDAVVHHLEDLGNTNVRENIALGTVLNRFGRPDEVASLALFLACDDDSSFITGACILVDGGSMCK